MNGEFTELVHDSMEQFAADIRLPAGLAGRARRHHRQRRFAQCTAIVAGIAVVAAAVVTGAGLVARTARPSAAGGRSPAHLRMLTTAYVVRRVSDALANHNLVLRDTRFAGGNYDGQPSSDFVTWIYQGHISEYLYGTNSKPLYDAGTALVDGKLITVDVDYTVHQWHLIGGNMLGTPPGSACATSNFLSATEIDANWSKMIRSSLACGVYHLEGYTTIGGKKTIKIYGSVVMKTPRHSYTLAVTLFVDPENFLPVRVTRYIGLAYSDDLQWLTATPANTAQALVTIPAGYPKTPLGD
jgi:hypothetical protein